MLPGFTISSLFLGLCAAAAYLIESVFGFGGTVVFLALGGFLFDFKDMIVMSMVASATCSGIILAQNHHHFHAGHFLRITAVALPFVVIGTALIDVLHSPLLLKGFAVLLALYGVQGLCLPKARPPQALTWGFVSLGGLIQGIFTAGGPFVLMGYRSLFAHKTELKATMAAFFLACNLWRMAQTLASGTVRAEDLTSMLWLAVPVAAGTLLGHRLHLRLSETAFQKGLLAGLTLAGVALLFR